MGSIGAFPGRLPVDPTLGLGGDDVAGCRRCPAAWKAWPKTAKAGRGGEKLHDHADQQANPLGGLGCGRLEGDSPPARPWAHASPCPPDRRRGQWQPRHDLSPVEPDALDVDRHGEAASQARRVGCCSANSAARRGFRRSLPALFRAATTGPKSSRPSSPALAWWEARSSASRTGWVLIPFLAASGPPISPPRSLAPSGSTRRSSCATGSDGRGDYPRVRR